MEKGTKIIITTIISFVFNLFGLLIVPIVLLMICNFIDYFTGIQASKAKGIKITSKISKKGIVDKLTLYAYVGMGIIIDILILYMCQVSGLEFQLPYMVSVFATIWLVLNELLSIAENCEATGRSIPFLRPIINFILKFIRGQVESTNIESEEDN